MILRILAAVSAVLLSSFAAQAQDGQPVVGIVQMDDLTETGQAENFSAMIETALISSGKFRVIERTRLATLLGEQGLASGGITNTNQPGRTGGFEGVDYLIYGSITQISAVNRSDLGTTMLSGILGGRRNNSEGCYNTSVRMEADIRITDTNSGEVKFASSISEVQESAAVCGGGSQIDSGALLRAAADNISRSLSTTIFPIQIAAVQGDGTMILNYGEGAVRRGDYLMLYGETVEIPDPAGTGTIRIDGDQIGVVQVSDVQTAFSRAVPVSEFAFSPPVGTVARPVDEDVVEELTRSQRRRRR